MKWEKGNVLEQVWLDRDVGGQENEKCIVCDAGKVDEQGRKHKSEKHAGSQMHTWQG